MTEIHPTVHDKLEQALQEFSRSPRFVLFKDIQVARLLPEECEGDSVLYDLTFEALVRQSGAVSRSGKLCTPAQAESLLHLLAALSEESDNPSAALSVREVYPQRKSGHGSVGDAEEPPEQTLSIVQLEQNLHKLLAQIKVHPQYETVATRVLADFWDRAWTPAPFEEMLTLRQLLSIDVAALFKKKTVTESRIAHVCQALERVLNVLDSGSPSPVMGQGKKQQKPQENAHSQEFGAPLMADHSLAALAVYEALAHGCQDQSEQELVQLAQSFLSSCSIEECVDVLLGRELSPALLRRLSALVGGVLEPRTLDLIRRLLEGPGIRAEYIARILNSSHTRPSAFLACVSTLVARALGASEAHCQGRVCAGFWTLNPDALNDLLKARSAPRVRTRKKNESRSTKESLDPFLLELIQVQGRPQLYRKGRPKGLKSRPKGGK